MTPESAHESVEMIIRHPAWPGSRAVVEHAREELRELLNTREISREEFLKLDRQLLGSRHMGQIWPPDGPTSPDPPPQAA